MVLLAIPALGKVVLKEKFPEFFQPLKQVAYLSSSLGNELLEDGGRI